MALTDFSIPSYNTKTYDKQRYERLVESVDEYLGDSEVGPEKFLDDLHKAILELRKYHDGIIDNFAHVQDFFK